MRNIAIIPARGGSKRIIKKNIKLFYGKPIIGWAIEAAEKSGLFEKIVISTDCKEIAQISRSLGGEVPFTRPDNISDDHSSVIEVIRHAIKFYETNKETFELATLIYPTAPLIKKRDLVQAVSLINKYDFAMSVTSYSYPIQRALELSERENTIRMIQPKNFTKRSQDLPKCYHDAGQFIVGKTESWNKKNPIVDGNTLAIVVPKTRAQDIDEEEDWLEAEFKFSSIMKRDKV